jgi:predicted transcriptional regulator
MSDALQLSRRERQIMEVIYRLGEATAVEVLQQMADPPSRTAVRTFLRILEAKGHLTHRAEGKEYVYKPARSKARVAKSALRGVLETFFGGSLERALAAHLTDPKPELSSEELERLKRLIEQAKARTKEA